MARRITPPLAAAVVAVLLPSASVLTAQEPVTNASPRAASPASTDYPRTLAAPGASLDTFLVLVPVRPASAITADIADHRARQQRAREDGERALTLQHRVEERVRIVKAHGANDRARAGAAKQLKDVPAEQVAKADEEAAKARVKHLELRRDLRAAEIELAVAHQRAAGAVVQSLQQELSLEARRAQAAAGSGDDAIGVAQGETAIAALELQVLESQREAVKKREEVTKKERAVIERRIKLHRSGEAL